VETAATHAAAFFQELRRGDGQVRREGGHMRADLGCLDAEVDPLFDRCRSEGQIPRVELHYVEASFEHPEGDVTGLGEGQADPGLQREGQERPLRGQPE
jgi:hypothetical protein